MKARSRDDVRTVRLGSVARIRHGYAFEGEYFSDRGVEALVTPGNFFETGGFRTLGGKQRYFLGPYPSSYRLAGGDLVVVMTEQAQGLLGSMAFVPRSGRWLHNQRVGLLELVSKDVIPAYLYYYCNGTEFRAAVTKTAAGTKVKHTSPKKLEDIEIRLPPLSEQMAITAALGGSDSLVSSLNRTIVKKRAIKLGLMQQLLNGRRRLAGFNDVWVAATYGDIVTIRRGEVFVRRDALVGGSVPVIAAGKEPAAFTNRPNRSGPVITVSASGASAGFVAYHKRDIFASDCSTISESSMYDLKFIYYSLALRQDEIYRAQTGGAQPHVHAQDVYPLGLMLPPTIEEQRAIASVISDVEAEINVLSLHLVKARNIKVGMVQQLLAGRTRLPAEAT